MGRLERFIMPSEEEFRRLDEAAQAKKRHTENRHSLIAKALRSHRKDALIQILTKLCDSNIHARWITEAGLGLQKPIDLLLHDLREAIRIATSFDDNKVNRNFSYDWEAYAEVKRLLEMLISCGAISDAMEIAVHFMEQASRQIENSKEGMMVEEVESCLTPILLALENHDETQRTAWAIRMQLADRVGFVCHTKLQEWSGSRLR
jgi:hypothetical protein